MHVDGRFAGILVRAGPAEYGQDGGDLDTGIPAGLVELAHQFIIGLGMVVEGDEVRVRSHLHVLVSEIGHHLRKLKQAVRVVERGGVKRDFHVKHSMVDQ